LQSTLSVRCTKEKCDVVDGLGSCLEGLDPATCSFFVRGEALSSREDSVMDTRAAEAEFEDVILSSGECLDVSQASELLRCGDGKVIALIGPTGSGKTSLICCMYEQLQHKISPEFQFAGSRTLVAFERALHDARAASETHDPTMEHTPHSSTPFGVAFYHLRLLRLESLTHLLMADRTGEDYKAAADDPDACADFIEVRETTCVNLLIDGKRLLDAGERHNVRSDLQMILQGLRDGGVLNGKQRLFLILTKWDEIRVAEKSLKEKTEAFFDAFVQHVRTVFGDSFSEVKACKTAASPKTDKVEFGFGVAELLAEWYQPQMELVALPAVTGSGRAMSRLREPS
jgi:energy-coupling factor transporter ATP-binding protein EcfA2